MRREDLHITVPSMFRCPISLDVMKSPVIVSTGVTYDRSSIQRWLDGGNNTCPATMQALPSKDLVPNSTLHRLIQLWSDSVLHHQVDSKSEQIESLIESLELNKDDDLSKVVECLSRILSVGEDSEEIGTLLSKSAVDLLKREDVKVLGPLSVVLKQGNVRSRIAATRIIELVAVDAESKQRIGCNDRLVELLMVNLRSDLDTSLVESSLSCLISLAVPKRVKARLVIHHRIISKLKQILLDKNMTVLGVERALKLLESATCCKEGKEEMCSEDGGAVIEAVVGKMLKLSTASTEHAVTVLWTVCYLFKDRRSLAAVERSHGLTKLLLILQTHCSPPVRRMAADLLKLFRVDSKAADIVYSYDTSTTHIMPY